ncbi:presenilin family intramembrane aspartyl protease PSH [Halostella litorea]|uniref:presenilin family intramembrane aspartyl protease PSH n=1 Tax=Halostella litorea TaxID=2528831 RepID=UPI001092E026|nr:presenilin family intramembrane aspartyl protease PSH [Halostella litorea]
MEQRHRAYAAVAATVGIFLLVQVGALALVEPFQSAGYQATEDPGDTTNSFAYLGAILVATVVMLAAIKFDARWFIRGLIVFTSGLLSWYVLNVVVPPVVTVPAGGAAVNVLAVAGAAAIVVGLLVHPEWYVIDAAGIIMGAGAAGIFGISFGILPAIVLLTALAVYDAISVYGTEHMLTLAEGVMDLNVPIMFVVPTSLPYSFLDAGDGADSTDGEGADDPEGTADAAAAAPNGGEPAADGDADSVTDEGPMERDALFIGLGDAVMPTIIVASAAFFVDAGTIEVPGIALNLAALSAMVGTTLGLLALMTMVLKGRAHAGLPLLNGGAIGGYLVGAMASGLTLVQALGL